MRHHRFFLTTGLLFLLAAAAYAERAPFVLGPLSANPGEIVSGFLPVPGGIDPETAIPVTIIHGREEGKVLTLVAGVHGYEYPPILSLYRLKEMIKPGSLSGTLVLVHIANLPGFQKRTVYYNPNDWKNLNRVFPGNMAGTQSERIAHILNTTVIAASDAVIDMHCGDANEALIPYCYWMLSGDKNLDAKTKEMVLAFGIKHIIIDKSRTKDIRDSKYLGNTAILQSIPAITTESGFLGGTAEEDVVRNVRGVIDVMKLFDMLEGEPHLVSDPVWVEDYEVVYSQSDGLFFPQTKMGYFVREGETVGYITDYFGRVIEEFKAPFSGMILYVVNTPPANKGEPVYEIGRIRSD
ncbi:MAG: M14 family metallopeptidase [Candidatus Aminicenantes bacterium]|nr:M14 family metallopeptidase [Candidatus Aminicenantes bacterium]